MRCARSSTWHLARGLTLLGLLASCEAPPDGGGPIFPGDAGSRARRPDGPVGREFDAGRLDGPDPTRLDAPPVAADAPPLDANLAGPRMPPPAACRPGEPVLVVADREVAIGKTAGAALLGCAGPLLEVSWTQTGGSPVTLLAARTQAISFDPPDPGGYRFTVSYRTADGATGSRTATVGASANPSSSRLTVRSDQAVRKRGNASVRAWPTLAVGEVMAGLTWQQLEGPAVKLDLADPRRIVFAAPEVDRDTLLRFRATVRTTGGASDSDDVLVVIEDAPQAADDGFFARIHVSRVHPFRPAGRYADRLTTCVFDARLDPSNGCSLQRLPLISQEAPGNQPPSVDDILARVLVSHDFLGASFEQFLRTQDPEGDFRRMLGAVTAVVIGAHVRPPIYYGATGAIYLDATDLWLTADQRDLIDEAPDYRLGFGDGLTFSGLTRWTVANDFAWPFYRRDTRASRSVAALTNEFGRVLYHELTHAADFFPPALHGSLDTSKTPNDLYLPRFRAGQLPSSLLANRIPLQSAEMKALGQVLFAGAMASDSQKGFPPAQVADFFRSDQANDTYSYATSREDLAMLVEEFMMAHRREVRRDVAITNKYRTGIPSDQLIVAWGQRGRIGEAAIKARVRFALGQILPWVDPVQVDRLPPPLAMPAGSSWYATVRLPVAPPPGTAFRLGPGDEERALLEQELARQARHRAALP